MNITNENMILIWLILLVAFTVVELATTQLVSIWFAGGSLVALILNFSGFQIVTQVIVFFIVSVVLLLITYPLYHKYIKKDIVHLNANSLIGENGVVIVEINNMDAVGQVKIKGQVWSAKSLNGEIIKENKEVTVEKIEGVHLIVKNIN